MKISKMQSYNTAFNGKLCNEGMAKEWIKEAMEYASRPSKNPKRLQQKDIFYKTIDAIQNDGTDNIFKVYAGFRLNAGVCTDAKWTVEYGSYKKETPYNLNTSDDARDAFHQICEFGKKFFGITK